MQAGESCQSGKRMRPNNKIIPNIKHKHMKSPIKAQPLHFESAENVRFSSQEIRNPEYFQFLPVVSFHLSLHMFLSANILQNNASLYLLIKMKNNFLR